VSSKGEVAAIDPKTGVVERRLRIGSDTLIGPIALDGMIYIVTQTAQLIAIR
jgi:hypothetical protein